MEVSPAASPRLKPPLSPSYRHGPPRYMNALDILRETVRVLRYNLSSFMIIASLLVCPVCALFLSNVLVDDSLRRRLTRHLLLLARSSGLPSRPFIQHSCVKFSDMILSSAACFPLFLSVLLLSKAAVVYSVDCTYSRKKADSSLFYVLILKIWRRIVSTYLWTCAVTVGCLSLFLALVVSTCAALSVLRFPDDLIVYATLLGGLVFSVAFANAVIVCSVGVVISVLEDVSGPQALWRSSTLIKGQTQVGLIIYLGSTIATAFVEGLFEHRVKTLSYGDGSSRIWEGPLLVVMYSFLVLIDSMMSAVFYFSCRSNSIASASSSRELERLPSSVVEVDI
ncbi:hypothetical protein MLD38_005545 [Melastoma candidum]|uniref:Uncharacterized protein n=1 Tax=Melastoma candidum TaxID=119954 RepID=A0ACB9RN13_9MYRT|nr:hypothetical protein MLD38_005545 [Melastoma candidum]